MKLHLYTFIVGLTLFGCGQTKANEQTTNTTPQISKENKVSTTNNQELIIKDTVEGTGKVAEDGDLLIVQYTGKLTNGDVFDTNRKEGRQPFSFRLGGGQVIKGWDQGMKGMKVGGERHLNIPYALAYGEQGRPPRIPAKAELVFEVKLLEVVKKGKERELEHKDIKVGTGAEAKKGQTVEVHYTGTLLDGSKFDSSKDRNETFSFKLGAGQVIEGWDQGVAGMKVGGKRILRLPPALAYGEYGAPGAISPNQFLEFEVELISVK